ncbi:MAG: hypothetical protein K6T86_14765, partial [Pirellulales bacterium]|nr:hypothetical protein [Pirellulales bacterium]
MPGSCLGTHRPRGFVSLVGITGRCSHPTLLTPLRSLPPWPGPAQPVAGAIAYVYDQDVIVLAFDGTGSLTNRYLHGPPPSL